MELRAARIEALLHRHFAPALVRVVDDSGKELTAADLWRIFVLEYGIDAQATARVGQPGVREDDGGVTSLRTQAVLGEQRLDIVDSGSGPIDAFVNGLNRHLDSKVRVLDYHEHAIGSGADARAAAYLELRFGDTLTLFGAGIDTNIVSASFKAIACGVQRAVARGAIHLNSAALA